MKRQHPLYSPFGLAFTFLLLAGLGVHLWLSGGMAFSPGDLTAKSRAGNELDGFTNHADFAGQCSRCHAPFETTQDVLCIACHEDIGLQIQAQDGSHADIADVSQCAACHSDHRGREFDPTLAALPLYDHALTEFSLDWHQVDFDTTPLECQACHNFDQSALPLVENCERCHRDEDAAFMNQHALDFGEDCIVCHDGHDRMADFDHQATEFPLDGRHVEADCTDCHQLDETARAVDSTAFQAGFQLVTGRASDGPVGENPFANTPKECVQCHQEPDIHRAEFSQDCAECHTAQAWSPAIFLESSFAHGVYAGFTLDKHQRGYDDQPLVCSSCHLGEWQAIEMDTCINCHGEGAERAVFMGEHRALFGDGCLSCHDGRDRMQGFDHASVFPLLGQHAQVECQACHQSFVFAGTPQACSQCHAEPAIHAGFFGLQCQYCHTENAWVPGQLRLHIFPLDHGGQGEIACQTCHVEKYIENTCYGCHEHQPEAILESHTRAEISPDELPNCASCHPTGLIDENQ